MPWMISVSKTDLSRSMPLPLGWQKMVIKETFAKESKDGDSINYVAIMQLKDDPNERQIKHNFNSKAMGILFPQFVSALAGRPLQEILDQIKGSTLNFDFESCKDKEIHAKIKHGEWQGRVKSEIDDFAPIDKVPF